MSNDYEYFAGKRPNCTYISKAFDSFDDIEKRRLRIISRVFDHEEGHEFVIVKGELVLRVTPGERDEVKAAFYEDSRRIKSFTIQRFTRKIGSPHQWTHFTFRGDEIDSLYNFIRIIRRVPLYGEVKTRLDDAELQNLLSSLDKGVPHLPGEVFLEIDDDSILDDLVVGDDEKRSYVLENWEIVLEILRNDISKRDVTALAYRRRQLELFERLLNDDAHFSAVQVDLGKRGSEGVWQQFFEDNPWIFGYGLNHIFSSRLDKRSLEQMVAGSFIGQAGKRVDALMKSRGLISSLCFVEIKTHKTPLLQKKPYRSECWAVSDELSGGVAQIQKTVQKALETIQQKYDVGNEFGDPIGETVYLYQPKATVVIGSLGQFATEFGVNEPKFSSFELFRRNIVNPEIITFDELYERARFIVHHSEKDMPSEINKNSAYSKDEEPSEEEEIPF